MVAAAGGHNLLIEGPPGVGKTMLARRLPGILPPLSDHEALEVTRIQSVAGLRDADTLAVDRPFRAPHHSVSSAGLVGGGALPSPGEVTLAHRGVLFLDELSEFSRHALEAMRQPLEDGFVTIVRRNSSVRFPARVSLIAATNPCPCGHAGDPNRCACDERALAAHARRLSGPLLDRFDLLVEARRPELADLDSIAPITTSEARQRVASARKIAERRWGASVGVLNAEVSQSDLMRGGSFSREAQDLLGQAYERGLLAPRGRLRVMRVARTIADLAGSEDVSGEHMIESLSFRLRPLEPS